MRDREFVLVHLVPRFLANMLLKAQKTFLIVTYLAIPMLVGFEMLSRFMFRQTFLGIEEITIFLVAYAYYVGAAYAARENSHITCVVSHLFPLSTNQLHILRVVVKSLSLVASCLITYYLGKYFVFVAQSPSVYTPFSFHKGYYAFGPFIGWLLMCLYLGRAVIVEITSKEDS